jgi:peptide/nickel transport system ATP-binding protein
MTIEETAGPVLQVKDLTMHYQTRQGTVKAVDGISFELARGEVLGLVGESGCGKTSIAVTLMKLLPDNALILKGQVLLDGQDLMTMDDTTLRKYRWRRISMIFQAAMNSLNPVHRVGDQIVEAIEAHDMAATLKEAQETVDRLFRLVGLDPRLTDRYPHEFSGGMRQRAVIAMALACQPDVIVADEPTTALDVIVQDRILRQIKEIQTDLNMSMIYITHDIAVVAEVTDRIGVMYAGKLVELGSTADVFERPIHPYTKALLSVFPSIREEKRPLTTLGGEPPNLVDPPTGCRFHPRCPYATAICQQEEPPIVVRDGHWAACWNPVG